MWRDLLIATDGNVSLDSFVASVSGLLGCADWAERESSNYVDGRYFLTTMSGIEIAASLADDAEFDDCRFWLNFEPDVNVPCDEQAMHGLLDRIAQLLAMRSLHVILPDDLSRSSTGGVRYKAVTGADGHIEIRKESI